MKLIAKKFFDLKAQKKPVFIGYICAGDPDYKTSLNLLKLLPQAGCDIIELGVPFLDPSGDGPIIENASKRAISAGMTLKKTLKMAAEFRKDDKKTPLILMSYYNPILKYGLDKIFIDADKSGINGILIVDLPFEESAEILLHLKKSNLDFINLIAPTTDFKRMKKIVKNSSGFLYLISMLGVTGANIKTATIDNKKNLQNLRKASDLPIAIGFGIKTPDQAKEFADMGFDGVIVGSTLVKEISDNFLDGKSSAEIVAVLTKKVAEFSKAIHLGES
ncbi:MAG: tryptophan synthase subunit alpha [Rickettsiales bacterium]|nr:tryptophan synthase subunit alpha [Rickettsiales bacterium]